MKTLWKNPNRSRSKDDFTHQITLLDKRIDTEPHKKRNVGSEERERKDEPFFQKKRNR